MARRKSTAGNSVETGGSFEVANTGLRPSWTEFWEAGSGGASRTASALSARSTSARARSTQSVTRTEAAFRQVKFISGGEWHGEWGRLGLNGFGTYRMPHGVLYEGMMCDGAFEGVGVLRYPNGGAVEGLWRAGQLVYCQYEYADGLRRDQSPAWPYCKTPDRRFYSEVLRGLKAADTEQLADAEPPAELAEGAYDAVDGAYDPRAKCTADAAGAVLRVPTVAEERWILERCRGTSEAPVGFRPELYANWWEEAPDARHGDEEHAALRLIRQLGCYTDPVEPAFGRRHRSTVDVSTVTDTLPSSACSHAEFDYFVRRAVWEAEEARRRSTVGPARAASRANDAVDPGEWFADSAGDECARASSLVQIVKEISQKYLARGKTAAGAACDSKTDTVNSTTTVEMTRLRALDVPAKIKSHASRVTAPFQVDSRDFSRTLSTAPVAMFTMRQNIVDECEEYERARSVRRPEADDGENARSRLKFEVDYEDFDSETKANASSKNALVRGDFKITADSA